MKQFFRRLFGVRHPVHPARQARPQLESLGDRLLPSATPLGPAFDVSGVSYANQYASPDRTVARAANGNFAVTWWGDGASGSGIYVRLFNASGAPLTSATRIAGTSYGKDFDSTIAMSDDGQFAVAWTHAYSATDDDIYVQRFNAAGSAVGGVIHAAASIRNEDQPSIAMDAQANLVVAYTYHNTGGNRDVSAWYRRVDGSGNVIQGTFWVAATAHDEYQASAALNDYGRGVVAYTYDYSASDRDIHAQRISALGYKVGGDIWVAASGLHESDASVAMNNTGAFVVAYQKYTEQTGSLGFTYLTGSQVLARRFDALGTYLGEVSVGDPSDTRFEYGPSVSMNSAGDFVIGYTHEYSSTDQDVRAQVFNSQGVAQGGAFYISGASAYDEFAPTVALGDDGVFVAGFGTFGQKQQAGDIPEGWGVSARRFSL
jgi:hypothetical protein